MAVTTMKALLEAGVHFGHQKSRWNPKMAKYIYSTRNDIHIIDLAISVQKVEEAYEFVKSVVSQGKSVLFVGTKKQAQEAVKAEAERCDMFYINQRWLGGTLTNFKTIRTRIQRLTKINEMEKIGEFQQLTKKEAASLVKERDALEKNLGGIKNMQSLPGCLFVIDLKREENAINEAHKLNIPIVAVVDTNCDPDLVDYVIPGNDDAIRAVQLFASIIADAVIEARQGEAGLAASKAAQEAPAEEPATMEEALAETEAPVEEKKEEKVDALVKALAEELFDSTEPLIRLDMTEYMEKHSVARMIGSPPGYVGYDEAGQLTEKVRRKPYSVILFDEIEKAHPDVMNILMQILDEGKVDDAQGRTINFENTIICMTSNAGSTDKSVGVGFNRTENEISKDKAMKGLREFLRPEFISRIDEIVVFKQLTKPDFANIAALMIDEMKEPLAEKNISVEYDQPALDLIAEKSFGKPYGARDIRRVIRQDIEDKIAEIIINEASDVKVISISADGDNLVVKGKKEI